MIVRHYIYIYNIYIINNDKNIDPPNRSLFFKFTPFPFPHTRNIRFPWSSHGPKNWNLQFMSGFSPDVAPPQPQPALSQPGCQVKGSFGAAVNSKELLCPTNSRSFPGESPASSDHHYLHWTYHPFLGTSPGPRLEESFWVHHCWSLKKPVVGSWKLNQPVLNMAPSPRLLMASQLLQHYIPETGSMLKHIFHAFKCSPKTFYRFPFEHGSSEVVVHTSHFYHPSHCLFYISTMILISYRLISHSQRSSPIPQKNIQLNSWWNSTNTH